MYFTDRASQLKACETFSQNRRQAASLYPVIAKVYRNFDGKVYNCRLEKALQEAAPENRIYCRKRGSYIEVYTCIGHRYEDYTLTHVNMEELTDGKRICAEKFIESAQSRRESLLKEAARMDEFAANIDEIDTQLKALKKAYNGIVASLPYTAQDILNVKRFW